MAYLSLSDQEQTEESKKQLREKVKGFGIELRDYDQISWSPKLKLLGFGVNRSEHDKLQGIVFLLNSGYQITKEK